MGASYSSLVFQPPPQPSYQERELEGYFEIVDGGM
jgi:hypothetical protein